MKPKSPANHVIHQQLPSGSLVELVPEKVDLARLDDEHGGYAIVATDGSISVRLVMPAEAYVQMIRSANEQLDTEGAPSGKLEVVKTLPPSLANGHG